jgi:hypothetical protein
MSNFLELSRAWNPLSTCYDLIELFVISKKYVLITTDISIEYICIVYAMNHEGKNLRHQVENDFLITYSIVISIVQVKWVL